MLRPSRPRRERRPGKAIRRSLGTQTQEKLLLFLFASVQPPRGPVKRPACRNASRPYGSSEASPRIAPQHRPMMDEKYRTHLCPCQLNVSRAVRRPRGRTTQELRPVFRRVEVDDALRKRNLDRPVKMPSDHGFRPVVALQGQEFGKERSVQEGRYAERAPIRTGHDRRARAPVRRRHPAEQGHGHVRLVTGHQQGAGDGGVCLDEGRQARADGRAHPLRPSRVLDPPNTRREDDSLSNAVRMSPDHDDDRPETSRHGDVNRMLQKHPAPESNQLLGRAQTGRGSGRQDDRSNRPLPHSRSVRESDVGSAFPHRPGSTERRALSADLPNGPNLESPNH